MRKALTSHGPIVWALLIGLLAGCGGVVRAQRYAPPAFRRSSSYAIVSENPNRGFAGQQQRPAPIERRPPSAGARAGVGGGQQHLVEPNGQRGGEHLTEWMDQHSGMTLQQQQQALDREPGFRELPAQTQQHMHERLAQLHAMSPLERHRMLALNEALERLTPVQQSQVRGAMQQLGSLPPDQRREVARSFHEIRELPPEQRMAAMNSGRYGGLNYAQRTTLVNLIRIAPMLPPPESPLPPSQLQR